MLRHYAGHTVEMNNTFNRMPNLTTAEGWAAEVSKKVQEQPWREAYVFFKHEDAGTSPKLAR